MACLRLADRLRNGRAADRSGGRRGVPARLPGRGTGADRRTAAGLGSCALGMELRFGAVRGLASQHLSVLAVVRSDAIAAKYRAISALQFADRAISAA